MTRWERLLAPERLAIWIFALLLATTFIGALLYRSLWVFGPLAILLLWITTIAIGIFNVGFAFREEYHGWLERLRAALAIPIAILTVFAINLSAAPGPRTEASIYLALHRTEMWHAQLRAGAGKPAIIPYTDGVPDGGSAIIRWHRNPMKLPAAERNRLVNGSMDSCRRIVNGAWLCGFG